MKSLRERAMDLLARREHSRFELNRKLCTRGFLSAAVEEVLTVLAKEGLQSDERFCESYVHSRAIAGFGPKRIEMELRQRGVAANLIARYVHQDDDKWRHALERVWKKKYASCAASGSERAKQQRFLLQRGFAALDIQQLLKKQSVEN